MGAGTALLTSYIYTPQGEKSQGLAQNEAGSLQHSSERDGSRNDVSLPPLKMIPNHIRISVMLLWSNGGVLLLYSIHRYFTVQQALQRNEFILAKRGLIATIFYTMIATSISVLLISSPLLGKEVDEW